jgi:hypothetical protein
MRVGITPRLFGDLAARAFVKAACRASTLRNGRINQSRVAVLTGLSRAEVRNVMRGSRGARSLRQPRTMRVVEGWVSDPRYSTPNGVPRALPMTGSTGSFAALVGKYAGDVPHHAVLEELRRLKLVREEHDRLWLAAPVTSATRALSRSLALLLSVVSDGVALSSTRATGAAPGVHRLTLRATDARESIAMHDRALSSAAAFVSGLDQSLRTVPLRNSRKSGKRLTVSVLVRLQEPDSKTRRHRNVPRD